MKVRLWGTRGSIASAGPETVRYGGDTSSVEVRTNSDRLIILDAGSGIRPLGSTLAAETRVDIFLSHLHMDHVQGLPFFGPLLDPEVEVHIWGPVSTTRTLRDRLSRYLSPPLFPVRVRDLANAVFHDVHPSTFEVDGVKITADLVLHPGATLGYRLEEEGQSLAYIPDHEPAIGDSGFPCHPNWMSGYQLTREAHVLIHDAQYDDDEYEERVGWGHTSTSQLAAIAATSEVERLVTFHHDPSHGDERLDTMHDELAGMLESTELVPGTPTAEISV